MKRNLSIMLATAAILTCAPASAATVPRPPPARPAAASPPIGLVITRVCPGSPDGSTEIAFHLSILRGHTWTYLADTGAGTSLGGGGVDVHAIDPARYGPGGRWVAVATVSGGETRLRFGVAPAADLVRMHYLGYLSEAAPSSGMNCPP